MKYRILPFLILMAAWSFQARSQCTPVHFPGPQLTMPDTSQGLTPVVATVPYHQVVHVRIPHDTLIPPLTVPVNIDSVGVIDIVGLPTGLNYVTNSSSDFWPGGSYGCIVIQGTVSQADTGHYKPIIQVSVVLAGNPLAFDYAYDMEVLDSINAGFSDEERAAFTVHQNVPNPFSAKTLIRFNAPHIGSYRFEVYDVLGTRQYRRDIIAKAGVNEIEFDGRNLASGIYFYRLSDGRNTIVKRMIVK